MTQRGHVSANIISEKDNIANISENSKFSNSIARLDVQKHNII